MGEVLQRPGHMGLTLYVTCSVVRTRDLQRPTLNVSMVKMKFTVQHKNRYLGLGLFGVDCSVESTRVFQQ